MGAFGEFLKARRAELGLSLRKFCEKHELDPSNLSKLERGRLAPPARSGLVELAEHLRLPDGTPERQRFFDLADAEAGRIPEDLKGAKLAAKLPVLFQALRDGYEEGGQDTDDLLEEIKRVIEKA